MIRSLAGRRGLLFVVLATGVALSFLTFRILSSDSESTQISGSAGARPAPERLDGDADVHAAVASAAARASAGVGSDEGPLDDVSTDQEESVDDLQAFESKTVNNLRSAIEGSLFGRLDPAAILDAALACADLDFDPDAGPQVSDSGRMIFPLTGAPEGMTARMEVGTPSNPKYAQALAIDMDLQAATTPLVLDGVRREPPSARVEIWTDDSGRVLDCVISTRMRPDYSATRAMGVDLSSGTFVDGLKFHVDPDGIQRMSFIGLRDGRPGTWETPVALDSQSWPRPDHLSQFTNRMTESYNSLHFTKAK